MPARGFPADRISGVAFRSGPGQGGGMAWRIDEAVIRGEIDNRVRGRVTGRIWFAERPEPVLLDLAGDCWRDLAGRGLEFTNPQPQPGDLQGLAAVQRGRVGDITASRKVRVPEIPLDQIDEYDAQRKPFPWHWGNSLYLEWFSDRNGRVVIEAAGFELKIVGDPAWEMSPAEEESQRAANGGAMTGFMERLAEAAGATQAAEKQTDNVEGDERPQTEEEAEQTQARSDLLTDRVETRLAREGDQANYERILEEEIERLQRELGEPEPTPEQLARNAAWIEELNQAAGEALADPPAPTAEPPKHPLAARAFELSLLVSEEAETQGWVPEGAGEEHPVVEIEGAVMKAAAKLAGALNGETWPPPLWACASIIVRLKRARVYLDDALRAMESCQEEKLVPSTFLGPILVEIIDLAHDADEIIAGLRERLGRGSE